MTYSQRPKHVLILCIVHILTKCIPTITLHIKYSTLIRSSKDPPGHHWKHGLPKHHHCGGRQQAPTGCGNHRGASTHSCLVQRRSCKDVISKGSLHTCNFIYIKKRKKEKKIRINHKHYAHPLLSLLLCLN